MIILYTVNKYTPTPIYPPFSLVLVDLSATSLHLEVEGFILGSWNSGSHCAHPQVLYCKESDIAVISFFLLAPGCMWGQFGVCATVLRTQLCNPMSRMNLLLVCFLSMLASDSLLPLKLILARLHRSGDEGYNS